ncbi:MAG: thioredoxin family protein [Sulfurimonas sp.]|jgi:thioredoxin-related protein|nr:thioredoxin family protein [Sulfurimonas sp.]
MKILISLILMFTLGLSAQIDEFASEVNYSRDYAQALQIAKEQNKLIMFVAVGDYCPWCKKFERKTLNSKEIKARVSGEFVPLIIDRVSDKGKYPEEFYAQVVPTVFFINPKTQKSVFESMGYMKPSDFSSDLDSAKAKFIKAK